MASELDFLVQFATFLLAWVQHYMTNSPHVLVIVFLVLVTTVITWRVLRQKGATVQPIFSISLIIFIIAGLCLELIDDEKICKTQQRIAASHSVIQLGSRHRVELVERIQGEQLDVGNHSGDHLTDAEEDNPLDGCLHVFVDLGSNRGIQIRKLYEPHAFPLAPVQPLYQRFFGKPKERNLREICSVSFEPSSKHASGLQELAAAYATCGIKVVLYKAGAGDKNTKTKFGHFNSFFGNEIGNDASARLIDVNATQMMFEELHEDIVTEEVDVMRFATFITDVVATRKLPRSAKVIAPKVVIKSDIEGAELKIILDMVVTGAFAHVDNLHMEWHGEAFYRQDREAQMIDKLSKAITDIADLTHSEDIEHKFEIEEMDDETYSGIGQFKPWGDYSDTPLLTC